MKRSNILPALIMTAMPLLILGSCKAASSAGDSKPLVIASIFPNFDFAREIGGEKVAVKLLLPPGVEAHGYEPRPQDLADISKAMLFVYTSDAMEPWAPRLPAAAGRKDLSVIESARGLELSEEEGHAGEADTEKNGEREEEGEEHGGLDPHVWLDPLLAVRMAENIGAGLAAADPKNSGYYAARTEAYVKRLKDLDARIESELSGLSGRTIIYGGHFAFGYFARRYGLEHASPYRGFSPNAEPSPRSVAELGALIRRTKSAVVFHEELVEPRVARVLAEEGGARLELLHGIHNLSSEDLAAGVSYIGLMEANTAKLKAALGAP